MKNPIKHPRNGIFALYALIVSLVLVVNLPALALPDQLSITATNTWTKLPVTFNLQRYNLRATNYQVRIFSDPTNYTLLPTNQIPEVTTYRGRITGDPGAMVVGTFGVDGKFYYQVVYGCRWQGSTSEYDPYDTTNRLSWGGMGAYIQTTNLPSLGYVYAYQTNMPLHITWGTNLYPAAAAVSYGGPPYLNNLKQVPVQRARLVLDSDYYRFFSNLAGSNVTTAILMQESRINDVDYEQARDLGICYQIACVCVRTNTQLPYTTTTGDLGEENSFWSVDPGYSHGIATNGWFDMVHGSVNVATAAGWAYDPGDFSVMDPSWSGFASGHEMGHNWGQNHYTATRDYTGDNFWHVAMDGSGLGYSTLDVNVAQGLRRTSWKGGIEWVQYNCPIAPHATPDLAVTKTGQAVSLNVLLNDYIANSNALTVVSFETNTLKGGTVTNLGNGVLQYTPAAGFLGYDLFHYYLSEASGLKSLTAAKVLVISDANPLLGEWPLTSTNGTIAPELTGAGQAATLFGSANFASGSVAGYNGGRALHLDGNGYLRLQGTWFDSYSTNLSISLWCRPDTTPAGEEMLFMKSSLDANNSPGLRLGMTASSFFFSGSTVGGQSSFLVSAPILPQAGVWYHVVGEIDRTSGLIRLYVNGVEYTSTTSTRTIPAGEFIAADNWPLLGMANDSGGSKSWYTGALADVRLYSQALSAAQVQAIFSGVGLLPAGGPNPALGAGNVTFQPLLTWQPGTTNNFTYNLYLGTNAANVTVANTASNEYQGQVASAVFTPATPLAASATYYWRVDEVYGTNVVTGPVWNFTTAPDTIHGGLRLYLSFDSRDTTGTNTYDRSVYPFHDGSLFNAPTQNVGQVNQCLSFNGSSTYVQTAPLYLNTSNATFLCWVNLPANQNSYSGLVMCHGGTTWSGLMIQSGTKLGYQWNDESGTWTYGSGPVVPTNQWVLAALSVTNNQAMFYLGLTNGVLSSTTNNHTHIFQAFDGPMYVGTDPFGGRNINGLIDEVCVWNRALSAAEIGQIFTNGLNAQSFAGARPSPNTNTFTWTGASDVYWTNALNWATNGVPGAANTVYFNDAAATTATQPGTNLSVAGINITGGLRTVTLLGTNPVTLGATGISLTNTYATLTLGAPVVLGQAQTWLATTGTVVNLTNKLSGSGNPLLTLTGGGTFNLNNNVSGAGYGGPVVLNSGTLSLPYGWNTPSLTGNVTVGTNAVLVFNTHPYSYAADNYTTNYGTITVNGDNHLSNLELRGGQLVGSGELRVGDIWGYSTGAHWASRSNSVTATISVTYLSLYNTSTTLTVENGTAEPDLLIAAPLKDGGNGAASFTKTGLGSLSLTQPSTYTGNTTNNQGTLNLSGSDNILPPTTGLFLATNTTLNLNGINQTVVRLNGFGTINLGSGSFTDAENGTNTFGGVFTGNPAGVTPTDYQTAPPGGIALTGTGRLVLTNLQTYTGDTWIAAGTLALTGSGALAGSSNIVITAGATLDASGRTDGTLRLTSGQTLAGFGSIVGKVALTNGATLSPGNATTIGSLNFNNYPLTLTGGQASMTINKTGGGSTSDTATGITTLTLGGTLTVTNAGTDTLAAGDSFRLFIATSYAGSFTNYNLPALPGGLYWNTTNLTTSGTLAVAAYPAPILSGASQAAGKINLTFTGANGQPWRILTATNLFLSTSNWTTVTNGTFTGTSVTWTNTPAATNPPTFYRIATP